MIDVLSTALSGLAAASKRILAGANNTANASTVNYTPQEVKTTAQSPSGVKAELGPRNPAFIKSYEPDSPLADPKGYVNIPNVQLDREAVDIAQASIAYKANAAVIRKERELQEDLLRALDTSA